MKYESQENAIGTAQLLGSKARTFAGAAKALIKSHADATPLHKRGVRPFPYQRQGARDYRFNRRAERIRVALGLWAKDEAEFLAMTQTQAILDLVGMGVRDGWSYNRSTSGWAGGNHHVSIVITDHPFVQAGSNKVWSNNGKWSGTDSWCRVGTNWRTLRLFPTLNVAGLLVIDAEQIGPREYRMTWAEQGRGFTLKAVEGWLIRGVHVHKTARRTLERARQIARQARARQANVLWPLRRHLEYDPATRRLDRVWVGVEDSLQAGNCPAGTALVAQEIRRRYGEVGGIRADALLQIRDDRYVRRAIARARFRTPIVSGWLAAQAS